MFRIYGLVNEQTGAVIYVGQTLQPLPARLAQARYEWKKRLDGKRKHLAISGVYALGAKLRIILLDHAQTQVEADEREQWWIDTFRQRGYAWGNTSAGGPGNRGVRRGAAQRRRISRSVKSYHRRRSLLSSSLHLHTLIPFTALKQKDPQN